MTLDTEAAEAAQTTDSPGGCAPADCSALPRRFYWRQCYQLGDCVHWALCDTVTDADGPPRRVTSLETILEYHEPLIGDRPFDEGYFPRLIVELLNAHFSQNDQTQQPPGTGTQGHELS